MINEGFQTGSLHVFLLTSVVNRGLPLAKSGENSDQTPMRDLSKALRLANQQYHNGKWNQAEQTCRTILADPNVTELEAQGTVWQILGMAQQRQGQLEGAIAAYQQAIAHDPTDVRNYNNLGTAFRALNRPEAAIAAYEQALEQRFDYPEAHNNLANLLRQQGQFEDAIVHYKTALELQPNLIDALHGLGSVYQQQEQYEQALQIFQQAHTLQPQNPDVLNNLGNTLQRLKQFEQAVDCYRQAIALRDTDPAFYNNLGAALQELGWVEESVIAYQQAIQIQPTYADAYYNLGNNYKEQDRLEESVQCYEKAIALRPNYPAAYNNLGLVLFELNRLEASIATYQKAIALRADYPDAHLNMGLSLLQAGDLQAGFREYEWRWQVKGPNFKPARVFDQPQWDGGDISGKTILLHAEQGFGDTIQFIRYVPLIQQRGGRVVVECQQPLVRLLQSMEAVAECVPRGAALPDFQVHAPIMSLPHLFGTTLDTIPTHIPYLTAPPTPQLSKSSERLRVGLVWAGSPGNLNDRRRSLKFQDLQPLLELDSIEFLCLQKEVRAEEAEAVQEAIQSGQLQDGRSLLGDFADTAAILNQLDLVLTVDTSVAHLAGALGHPVWVLLAFAPDWRWMLNREDNPWYPTARLFRQSQPGQWHPVIQAVITTLKSLPHSPTPPLPHPSTPSPLHPSTSPPLHSPTPAKLIGIGWQLTPATGWGVYGMNLALQLFKAGYAPVPLLPPMQSSTSFNPLHWTLIRPFFAYQQKIAETLKQQPQGVTGNFLLLRGLGNQVLTSPDLERITGRSNVGVIFFENTQLSPEAIARTKDYDLIVTGSRWNEAVLRSHGCTNVQTVFQGIDPAIFHPALSNHLFGDRFVIFSGGKLEYRKGQDLVISAFRIFQARHPDALLLTAWHNFWPQTMAGLEQAGHVTGLPTVDAQGRIQIIPWLIQQGIPTQAVVDVGAIPNHLVGQVVREADVALFPNRAEGGTNLAAMECLACGVPTILSANTGHLDLIAGTSDHCYVLDEQHPVNPIEQWPGTEGWGESSVDEIVERLEQAYGDRSRTRALGQRGAAFMQNWTWNQQIQKLLAILSPLL